MVTQANMAPEKQALFFFLFHLQMEPNQKAWLEVDNCCCFTSFFL